MFIAALFTIAQTRKQPKQPPTVEQNKPGSFVERLMDTEAVIQSKIRPKEKNKFDFIRI